MKCAYCKNELKEGCVFCPSCGKDIQIVPDYNEFEDEFLNELVAKSVEKENQKELLQKKKKIEARKLQREKEKKMKIFIGLGISCFIGLILILLLVSIQIEKAHEASFDFQIKKAEKAMKSKDYESAISYYEKALSIEESDVDTHFILAELYQKEGYTDAAVLHYKQIIQGDSDNAKAIQSLIDIYEENHQIDEIMNLKVLVGNSSQEKLFSPYIVAAPEFEPKEELSDKFFELTITSLDQSDIYYSLDGTDPVKNGILYERPIPLDEEKRYHIQAVCLNSKGIYSEIAERTYEIKIEAPKRPEVTPDGGSFVSETTVLVRVPKDCVAYYTWDGRNPDTNSKKYEGYILIPEGNNVLSVVIYNTVTQKYSDIYRGRFEYYAE